MFTATPVRQAARTAPAPTMPTRNSERFMWLTNDRVLYVGLLGAPTVRTMGCVAVYVATAGQLHFRLVGGAWQTGEVVWCPPTHPTSWRPTPA